MVSVEEELRIMHACEKGASGVYRGHKCVARYFYREVIKQLDEMKSHEKEHSSRFYKLIKKRNGRTCYGSSLFYFGGLFYGVFVAMFGKKAIGTSTSVIEGIVCKEFQSSLSRLENEKEICQTLEEIVEEEKAHKAYGKSLIERPSKVMNLIQKIAKSGAYTSKYLASKL